MAKAMILVLSNGPHKEEYLNVIKDEIERIFEYTYNNSDKNKEDAPPSEDEYQEQLKLINLI